MCDPSVTSSFPGAAPPLPDAQAIALPKHGLFSSDSGVEAPLDVADSDRSGDDSELSDYTGSGKRKRFADLEDDQEEDEDETRGWLRQRVGSLSDVEIEAIIEDDRLQEELSQSDGNASPSEDAADVVPAKQEPNCPTYTDDAAQSSRLGARIYLPDDEELMEAVVEGITRSLPRAQLYKRLARTLGGRFANMAAHRVAHRVYWLRDLWLNPAHSTYASMTTQLKTLMAQYVDLSEKQRTAGPVSTVARESCAPSLNGGGKPGEDEQFPPLESSGCGDINSELEEKVALIVLKHSPGFSTAPSKLQVWHAIAVESRGRYKMASSAKLRTMSLCKVASSPHHPKNHEMTPALRLMLLTIQSHSNGETTITDHSRIISERKDTLLMEFVLRQRPFERDGESISAVWAEIVASVKHPGVVDARTAEKRVLFLIQVLDNRQHAQQASLTTRLRFLLRKYKRVVANKPNPASRSRAHLRIAAGSITTQSLAIGRGDQEETVADVSDTCTRQSPTSSTLASPPSEFNATSLTNQVAQFESEQREMRGELRELRGELHELHGELRSQRECHHRETTAMVELLEKERQDRKDEFTAMIALLTRFGVPVGAPQATAFTQSGSNNAHSTENCLI